ncbi:MAG: hypothetical protein PHE43_03215 [Candidatus Nanoarchaeia archaeon]|nr:hypothetical protein [Candidatus Nanoarchaeia archaeon]
MKIKFTYAFDYDRMLGISLGNQFSDEQMLEMRGYLHDVENFWKNEQKPIIETIQKVAGMRFRNDINCYLVKDMFYVALSHPFTLKKEHDFEKLKAIMIHELIHILFVQNEKAAKEMIHILNEKYPRRDIVFKSHLPLFLIEKKVIETLYGKGFMKKVMEIDRYSDEFSHIWKEANQYYPKFNGNILKFLEKEVLKY